MRLLTRVPAAARPARPVPGRAPAWQRRYRRHRRVLAALLAAVVTWGVVSGLHPPAPVTLAAAVARHDLVPGSVLRADDVALEARPAIALPADVLADPAAVVGRTVAFPVRSGEPLSARHVVAAALLGALGPGLVATPVTLADPAAAALVSAGDVVDILSATSGSGGSATSQSTVVASRVHVLVAPAASRTGSGGLLGRRIRRSGSWLGARARHHHRAGARPRTRGRGSPALAHGARRLIRPPGVRDPSRESRAERAQARTTVAPGVARVGAHRSGAASEVRTMLKGFRDFVMRGNVLDLAVAVVIGAAFTAVVAALVEGIITPLIAAIFGKPNLDAVGNFTINNAQFSIGVVLTALLNFVLVAAAVYFVLIVPMNKMRSRYVTEEAAAEAEEIALLREIRDELRARS